MGKQKPYDVWVDPAKVSAVWNKKGFVLQYKGHLSKTAKRPRSTKYQLFDENRCPNKTAALAHASDTGFMSATAPLRQRMAISARETHGKRARDGRLRVTLVLLPRSSG